MATINNKLIHFKSKSDFNGRYAESADGGKTYGDFLGTSIVFIQDAKQIWTHGQFYDANETTLASLGITATAAELNYMDGVTSNVQTQLNEIKESVDSISDPYEINLTNLLSAEDSQSISTAIGGIDNLNATVQDNRIIVGTISNGSVSVSIRILGNVTTLYYLLDSVVSLTLNEIAITNTSGTLSKKVTTHSVITENMVINNLNSDETTLPLSAAQGKALKEETETTYQKITDNTLATTAKTIVGAINEVNESILKTPYNVGLLSVIWKPNLTSEEIDTAIGGWDNLVYAIQHNRLIVESITEEGTTQTLPCVAYINADSPNQITLVVQIFPDALTITIVNTDGILNVEQHQNSGLLEDSNYNSLQTTDKTIIGAINEVRASIEAGGGSGSGDDSSVVETIDLSSPTETGKAWVSQSGFMNKENATDVSDIKVVSLSKGDIAVLTSSNYLVTVPICVVSSDNTKAVYDTGLRGNLEGNTVSYMATEDCFVALTYKTEELHSAYVVKSLRYTAIADAVTASVALHSAYERCGAVYNSSTGYWELNGLTDLTEEDMLNIFLWSSCLLNSPNNMSYIFLFAPLRTTFHAVTDHDWNMHTESIVMTGMCMGSDIEVLSLTNPEGGSGGVILISDASNAFNRCSELVRIADCLDADNSTTNVFANAFIGCSMLREVSIRNLNSSLDFSSCPLITYNSMKFIVDNSRPSQNITITVHPTTWSYMSDPVADIPEEVGGTYAQWRSMKSTAMTKRISFATK